MSTTDLQVRLKRIDFAVSINCNLQCKMCGVHEPLAGENGLSQEEVQRVLCEARELGLERIIFSGGEVLLRKDIFALVSYARDLKLVEITLVTNGTLINEVNAGKLVEAGMSNIAISLEGYEPINDYLRGKGTFKKAVAAIGFFQKYQEKVNISVNVMISKYNYRNLFQFTKFLNTELGIVNISYSPLNQSMMGTKLEKYRDELVMLPNDLPLLTEEIEKVITYSREQKGRFDLPEAYLRKIPAYFAGERIVPSQPCRIPSESCGIDSAGNVFPCWVEYRSAGNIRQEALRDILAKQIYLQQCEAALRQKCHGCLVSCYPEVHESTAASKEIDYAL